MTLMIRPSVVLAAGVCSIAVLSGSLVIPGGSDAAKTKTKTAKVVDSKFSPKTLKVSKGTRVTWVWDGALPHDVIGTGPAKFRSKLQTEGKFSTVLKKPGTYTIICSLHKSIGMTGKIVVK